MTVQAKNGGPERTIPVDAILMSAGWTPSVHLFSQSRGNKLIECCWIDVQCANNRTGYRSGLWCE